MIPFPRQMSLFYHKAGDGTFSCIQAGFPRVAEVAKFSETIVRSLIQNATVWLKKLNKIQDG
jgi:hypothetical protein